MARLGNITIKSRPIRLGFLVEPGNTTQVREAIRLATTVWGGAYCPIIPVYRRLPTNWKEGRGTRWTATSVALGYLTAFDPDALVAFTTKVPPYIKDTALEVLEPESLWADESGRKMWSPRYGVGILELLGEVFERSFKFKAKYPTQVVLPILPKKHQLFWASVFGELPSSIEAQVRERFTDAVEITNVSIEESAAMDVVLGTSLFPRRLTQQFLKHGSRGWHDAFAFYMDASNVGDVIDYWNLRALGRSVIPIPHHLADQENFRKQILKFLLETRRSNSNDPKNLQYASIVRSDHSTMEQMEVLSKAIRSALEPADPAKVHIMPLQHWYPRMWDDWARDKDSASPDELFADEQVLDIKEGVGERISWTPLLPKFAEESAIHGGPKCANEIGIRLYGGEDYAAEAFPRFAGQNYLRAVTGRFTFDDHWRVGRNGLVRLIRHSHSERVEVPSAERVFFAWLEDQGWNPEISPPGRLAKQIHRQLDGWGRALADEKLVSLLEYMNGGRRKQNLQPVLSSQESVGGPRELSLHEVRERLKDGTRNPINYLIEKGVFHLGLEVQCPHCVRRAWHSMESLGDSLKCPRCLKSFPAIGNSEGGTWRYRTAGPFSVPHYADGAYTTLLALEFFGEMRQTRIKTTRALSFTASRKSQVPLEADFAFLWQSSSWREQSDGVAFGECKTYGLFERKDIARMKQLAKAFPGSVLVFATLRDTLTREEVRALSRFARSGRKYWKPERPINPVLILTKHELMHLVGPPYCWESLGVKDKFQHIHGLLDICNATQQIHLGLPPWEHDWQEQWNKKHKAASSTPPASKPQARPSQDSSPNAPS